MDAIIQAIDQEIQKLQQVRNLLAKNNGSDSFIAKAGKAPATKHTRKRKMSAEGRARIAEAQRKRWAAKKKAKTSA